MNALSLLDSIIERLRDELQKYAARPDANEFYLRKQNELVAELIEIYNSLDSLKYAEMWAEIENTITQLEMQDPELSAHCITIKTRLKGKNTSLININPFV